MGIGTLGERSLHAELKRRLEPDISRHEQEVDGYVADVLEPDGSIIEIQTRGFSKLSRKLPALLEGHDVTLVWPAPRRKWLVWVDGETGETTQPRKSPKLGTRYEVFMELRWIRPILAHPRLTLRIVEVDVEEYRHLDGWNETKKRGSTRAERLAVEYGEEYLAGGAHGWSALIPDGMPDGFTTRDYMRAAGVRQYLAQTALNILAYVGAIRETGRKGRMKLYRAAEQ